MVRRLLAILGLLAWLVTPWMMGAAAAEEIRPDDVQAIRAVVQSQLDAFSEDNAERAFELASVSAREQLGTADNLLQIIKREYKPIYRHRVVIFAVAEVIHDQVMQLVRLTDIDNVVWVAVYIMQRDNEGSWKIDGCQLMETTSISI